MTWIIDKMTWHSCHNLYSPYHSCWSLCHYVCHTISYGVICYTQDALFWKASLNKNHFTLLYERITHSGVHHQFRETMSHHLKVVFSLLTSMILESYSLKGAYLEVLGWCRCCVACLTLWLWLKQFKYILQSSFVIPDHLN